MKNRHTKKYNQLKKYTSFFILIYYKEKKINKNYKNKKKK